MSEFVTPTEVEAGDFIDEVKWNQDIVTNTIALLPCGFSVIFPGGGAAVVAPSYIEFAMTIDMDITAIELLADVSGSAVVDIWRITSAGTYSAASPGNADTICAAAPPTLAGAIRAYDSTLTGWSKSLAIGDRLRIVVESCTTCTRLSLTFYAERT